MTEFAKIINSIQGHLDGISEQLVFAAEYIDDDPQSSLTKTRIVMERILKEVYRIEMDEEPGKRTIGDLFRNKQFRKKFETRVFVRVESIRQLCNLGPHDHNEDVSKDDAVRALNDILFVIEWYIDRYGSKTSKPQTEKETNDVNKENIAFTPKTKEQKFDIKMLMDKLKEYSLANPLKDSDEVHANLENLIPPGESVWQTMSVFIIRPET